MASLRYATSNLVESDSIAASPALETSLPEANLLDTRRAYPARSTSTAAQAITGDFAANATLDFGMIWGHNLTDSATWRLRLYSAITQGGSVLYDSTATACHSANLFDDWAAARRFAVDYFTQQTTVRSFKLDITDAANPDGYLQIGQFWLGEYTELTKQILHGFSHVADGGAKIITPPGGGSYASQPYTGGPVRKVTAGVQLTTQADRNAWATFMRKSGAGQAVWVDPFPTDADDQQHIDHAMLGLVQGKEPVVNRVRNIYRSKLTITEV